MNNSFQAYNTLNTFVFSRNFFMFITLKKIERNKPQNYS